MKEKEGTYSSDTATESDGRLFAGGEVRLLLSRELLVDKLVRPLVDGELTDGVCGEREVNQVVNTEKSRTATTTTRFNDDDDRQTREYAQGICLARIGTKPA